MGAKESKISFLSYEEAVKRVSEEELERIRNAFKRHSGNSNILPKSIFFNEVLGELVPVRLSEQLYMTCNGSSKGISFQDVLIILVLITKGEIDEKVRFLFYLVSVDGTVITKEDLENFYNACDGGGTISPCSGGSLPSCINEAFWRHDKLDYAEFYKWVSINAEFSAITRWLLEEQRSNHGVKLSSDDDTPSFYHSLANITKLTEKDVVELEKRYWVMKSLSKTGRFDLATFQLHVCPPLPEQFCKSFFDFFDKNKDDHIDFQEMVVGISICCRGSTYQRLIACFEMFDADKDNCLSQEELNEMAAGLLIISNYYDDNNTAGKTVDDIIEEVTLEQKNGLTLDEFRPWASTSSLIHEFLLLLSQICHIVFGLNPGIKEEEGCIVRRWLDRENKTGLQPGLLYYIIPMNWWNLWKDYVNFDKVSVQQPNVKTVSSSVWYHELKSSSTSNIGEEVSNNSDKISLSSSTLPDLIIGNNQTSNVKRSNQQDMPNGGVKSVNKVNLNMPGPIDNTVLLGPPDTRKLMVLTGEGGKLKKNVVLMYGKDYDIVPEQIWKALFTWYGGNIGLPRTVIMESGDTKPKLELYPIQVLLFRHTPPPKSTGFSLNSLGINNVLSQIFGSSSGTPATSINYSPEQTHLVAPRRTLSYRASFSRKNTIRQIIDFISNRLKIHVDDLRLWNMENENSIFLLEEDEETVQEINLKEGSQLLIEVRNRDLSWPEEMNSLVATRNFHQRSNTGQLEAGATGLHNLGNTCFMNSAVQCLSSTQPLTQYFLSKLFTCELNKTNPLGMKGILAKRYGDLVSDLWSGIYRSIAPVKLRWTIGRYAPRFNGFQQHDSQELLSFLLDGLHEDLNRVHDKPYVELNDSDGRPDTEVANEAWQNHVKRDQSIVVDLFQGQLKSQVRCSHCGHVSVRFDPFTFLSLPLPMESSIHVEIPVFLLCGEAVQRYSLLLSHDATIKMMRQSLSELCHVRCDNLLLAEVVGATIRSFLTDNQKLRTSLIGYVYAYEIDSCVSFKKDFNASPTDLNINNPSVNSSTSNATTNSVSSRTPPNVVQIQTIQQDTSNCDKNSLYTNKNKNKNNPFSRHLKPKLYFRKNDKLNHHQRVDVLPKQCSEVITNSTQMKSDLELPEILNTWFSPNHTLSPSSAECVFEAMHSGLVIAMNRKMIQSTNYFLSWQSFRPMLFGVPVLLSCLNDTTNQEIYENVWRHVSKYVTGNTFGEENSKKYPFEIKAVDKEGNYCVWCPWYRFCRGCPIPCDEDCFAYTSSYLAIDWNPTVLHLQYQQSQEKNFIDHESVEKSYKLLREPISLHQCLKDFTKEEQLGDDETWYCSKCKEHRTIAKKFDIWKLPPILVIHLKRFQLVNNRWVKSNKLVRFPTKEFDPSIYLAKKKEISTEKKWNSIGSVQTVNISQVMTDTCVPVYDPLSVSTDNCIPVHEVTKDENIATLIQPTKACVIVDEIGEDEQCLYDLYAISCHSGLLSGGHYITYARNPNGNWYCYNDSTCKEVDPNIVENETPYMLFYEKRNLNAMDYMPNIRNLEPTNVQQEEDDFEKEVKKYCAIM